MRLLIRVAVFFYVVIISIFGFSALLLLAHLTALKDYVQFLHYIYNDPNAGIVAGLCVAATMIISYIIARIIYGRQEKERIISFDNPLGRVTISLSALEDLIRNLASRSPQIKEIKPHIVSGRKGLAVDIRLVLRPGANIPQLTADLQEIIKAKIHDVIGKEERASIRIHVIKIAIDHGKSGKSHERDLDDEAMEESPLRFHGYRA
jgi:uncharacterized alkaline shock family protein YloU